MTKRIYVHLVLIAGSFCCTSFAAAADVFMCERAAQFGFTDSLCEKPLTRLDNPGEQLKLNAPAAGMAQDDDSNAPAKTFGHAKSHWQAEWSNWTSWEHVHRWNSFEAFYPFTGCFDHDWFQLRLPHVHPRALSSGPRPGSRPKLPPH